MESKLDRLEANPFLDGPGEFLAKSITDYLIRESHFKKVFSDSIDPYERQDYSMRELPAMRCYVQEYTKETESHYIVGDVHLDVILPPSIRRVETEQIPSRIATALLQQFRRDQFFAAMCVLVPGLNELGKVFRVDKNLTFQNTEMNDECPVVKILLNFRLDLKLWDQYLEDQGRTTDDPFDVTLENLALIATTIEGLKDDQTIGITLESQQNIGEN